MKWILENQSRSPVLVCASPLFGLQIKAEWQLVRGWSTPSFFARPNLTAMGFGDLKLRLSSKLGSSSSPTPSPVSIRSPLSPGSSKVDHIYGFDLPSPVTSPGLAQSYYDGHHGPPPPYHPESGSDSNARPTDAKMPTPYNAHTGAIYTPTDATGESPLKVLEKHDIVIVLDDSRSMTSADRRGGRTRWDQVR